MVSFLGSLLLLLLTTQCCELLEGFVCHSLARALRSPSHQRILSPGVPCHDRVSVDTNGVRSSGGDGVPDVDSVERSVKVYILIVVVCESRF